jgi:phosphatidylglycerophosphatase A
MTESKPTTHRPLHRTPWAWTVATFLGVGNLRPGPGTYGSIAAVLLWLAAGEYLHRTPLLFFLATLAAIAIVTAIGIPASTIVEREAGREDPGFVVIDEVAGQLLAALALSPTLLHAGLALVLFRIFDIAKPWPIRRLERLPAGTGIMLDDLAAGLLACMLAHLLVFFVPSLA